MSLVQFFRILYARRWIPIAALLSALVAAVIMIQVLPKRYSANARIMFDIVKPDPITGQVLQTQFLRSYTKTQIELIKDYQTAGEVVDRLGWTNNPELLQAYFQQTGGAGDAEGARRWLAGLISSGTDAGLIESSNILEIKYTGNSPDGAKRIVSSIREVYLDSALATKRDSAGATSDWLREQAVQAEALVKSAEADRARFAAENGIVLQADNVDLESSRLSALSVQAASASAQPISINMGSPGGISPNQLQLEQVTQQLAQAGRSLGPNHPTYQSLDRQRAGLERVIAAERAALARPASTGGSVDPRAAANAAYEAQKRKVVAQSGTVNILNRMTRDIESKREQLAKLNERANDTRLSANVSDTGMTPMGSATGSAAPTFPNVPLIVAGSIGFGGMFGVVLSLLVELLGRRVRSQEDLERATGAPVFAEIGARPKRLGLVRKLLARTFGRGRGRQLVPVPAE